MLSMWEKWGGLVQRLLASIGSQLSLVAFVFLFFPQPIKFEGGGLVTLAFAFILACISIWLEVASELAAHKNRKTFEQHDQNGIKGYMRQWIGQSGRAAVWTRDLSWVNDDETKNLLKAKAASGNLTICMPAQTELGKTLQSSGATIHVYGNGAFLTPESRFTIAFLGNGGSKVAIGRLIKGMHVIEELESNDPAFLMASDLINLAELLAKKG